MKRIMPVISIVILFLSANAFAQDIWTPEKMMLEHSIRSVALSPDGAWVAYTMAWYETGAEKSETNTQIWISAADGSRSYQLTRGEANCFSPAWSPDGKRIAFIATRGWQPNVWIIDPFGGEGMRLTNTKNGVGAFKWSPDGGSIAFLAADPDPEAVEKGRKEKDDAHVVDGYFNYVHLYVVPAVSDGTQPEAKRLTSGDFSINEFDWSPDGATIVFSHQRTPVVDDWPTEDISLVPAAGGDVKPLVSGTGQDSQPRYRPDGASIAFTSERGKSAWAFYHKVCLIPAAGGAVRELGETYDGQANLEQWAADGSGLYFTEARGMNSGFYFLPADGNEAKLLIERPGVRGNYSFSADGRTLAYSEEDLQTPEEVYVSAMTNTATLIPSGKKVSAINAHLPNLPLGKAEEVTWKSNDGKQIEGMLYYPVGYEAGKKYPLLLNVHGGPTGVFQRNYIAGAGAYPLAAFAAKGFIVLRPNPRGSSGYGKDFRFANYNDWGGMDYQDLMSGVDSIIARGMADPERLGVMGWSYGGYMTSTVITKTARFKAAAVGAGVTDLVSFTGTADIPGFIPDYFGGELWEREETYRAHSAMFHIGSVVTPTLILHGEKDVRVPTTQGYELYTALKRKGVPVLMVTYPRQPHGVREPKLLLDVMNRHLDWFVQRLLDGK